MESEVAPINRKSVLNEGIKRLTRLLAAENASTQRYQIKKENGYSVAMGTDTLFSSKDRMPTKVVESYKEFHKGVRGGIEELDNNCWLVIGFEPGHHNAEPEKKVAPNLTVHPVVIGDQLPGWVALEIDVDKSTIQPGTTLKLDILTAFRFTDTMQASISKTARAMFRVRPQANTHVDIDVGYFPIMTAPMAHTLICRNEAWSDAFAKTDSGVQLLLLLPPCGGYIFNLYGISLECM